MTRSEATISADVLSGDITVSALASAEAPRTYSLADQALYLGTLAASGMVLSNV